LFKLLTWQSAINGLPQPLDAVPFDELKLRRIAASPINAGHAYVATSVAWDADGQTIPTINNGVFRTVDGGASWQHASNGLPRIAPGGSHANVLVIALHPTDPQIAWIAVQSTDSTSSAIETVVYKTTDGSQSWFPSGTGLPADNYKAIVVEKDRPDYVYIAGDRGVYFSNDGGTGWQRLGDNERILSTQLAIGDQHVYASGLQGIQRIRKPGLMVERNPGFRALPVQTPGTTP
jgi:hypothetical protein